MKSTIAGSSAITSLVVASIVGVVIALAGCTASPPMGAALQEMVQAQTDPDVSADNVGGSMAGIGDRVGQAYRGDVDKPDEVKDSMNVRFIRK